MKKLTISTLSGLSAVLLLLGVAYVTHVHELEYPRLLSDIVVGCLIAWVTYLYQVAKGFNLDSTTGLYRREIAESKLLTYSKRRSDICVAILDVNGLKRINDNNGHEIGDKLLKEMANRLTSHGSRHPRHTVARLGGDEFIVIAPKTETRTLSEQLIRVLRDEHVFGNWGIASAGVARTRTGDRGVLGCADRAMYRAKKCGKPVLSYDILLDGLPVAIAEPSTRRGPTRNR